MKSCQVRGFRALLALTAFRRPPTAEQFRGAEAFKTVLHIVVSNCSWAKCMGLAGGGFKTTNLLKPSSLCMHCRLLTVAAFFCLQTIAWPSNHCSRSRGRAASKIVCFMTSCQNCPAPCGALSLGPCCQPFAGSSTHSAQMGH